MASTRDRETNRATRAPLLGRIVKAGVLAAALIGFAPAIESCRPTTGTDVGNGIIISLNMTGYEAPPAAGTKGLQLSTGVVVDDLWVATSRFRFRQGADCSVDETKVDVPGPLVADLAGQGFIGGARDINRSSGPYCRLRLEFEALKAKDLPSGAPVELTDASVLMRGKRADGTPFVVRSKINGEYRLDAKGQPFDLPEGQNSLVIGFEIGALTSSLGLDSLSGNPILVDDNNNKTALQQFEIALKSSSGLFRDGNDDGALEPNERADGQEIASGSP